MNALPETIPVSTVILASWVWCVLKLRQIRRHPDDRALQAMCLALTGLALSLTDQFTAAWLDRVSHVPDLGRLVGNCAMMIGVCGGGLYLMHTVQGSSVRPSATRGHLVILGGALAGVVVLFVLTPPQPVSSLGFGARSTHPIYASPYVFLYTGYLTALLTLIARLLARYPRRAKRWPLRAGLSLLLSSAIGGLAYCVTKAGMLAAHYLGIDVGEWEWRLCSVLYLLSVAAALSALTVPAIGSWSGRLTARIGDYRSYRRLLPLWRFLYQASPHSALLTPMTTAPRALLAPDLGFHLYRIVIEIRDAQLALRPYREPRVAAAASALAHRAGLSGRQLDATIEAAGLVAALDAKAAGGPSPGSHATEPRAAEPPVTQPHRLADEIHTLQTLRQALFTSPIVHTLRQQAREDPHLPGHDQAPRPP